MKKILLKIINLYYFLLNFITFKRKRVKYGKDLIIHGKIYIHGTGTLIIGNNVTICSNPRVNASAGGNKSHLFIADSGKIVIGDHVGISHVAMSSYNSIEIEDYVLIGSNCMIADTDFHSLDSNERVLDDGHGVVTFPVKICKHAFIGARSIILKGVTIGENSIIGAGSVVTKNVPPNELWAGNPARYIRNVK